MKKCYLVVFILAFLLSGCSIDQIFSTPLPTPTPTPAISDTFKQQITQFLEDGTKLNAMAGEGVNYLDYQSQLASTKGTYDFVVALWPAGYASDAKKNFDKAVEGWGLALDMWGLKINDKDNPVEPDINGYLLYVAYEGNSAVYNTHPSDYIVPNYQNKSFLPFDENIGVLLNMAGSNFQTGRTFMLAELPK